MVVVTAKPWSWLQQPYNTSTVPIPDLASAAILLCLNSGSYLEACVMADREGNLSLCMFDAIDKLQAFETHVWVEYYRLADNLCIP